MLRTLASCEKSALQLRESKREEVLGGGFMCIIIDLLGHSVGIRGLWWNGVRVSGYIHFPMRVDRLQVEKWCT